MKTRNRLSVCAAFAALIEGKPFAPDERMKKILTEAAAVGDATARTIMYRWRTPDGYWYPNSTWRLGFIGGYKFEDNGARLLDAYSGFFFYATGVTPAMDTRIVGEGSQYMAAFVDANGDALDGAKNYKLHLPLHVPVKNFWSVILYSDQTRSMLQTDQQYPSVSSQTKGLLVNDDGSVDVYFGPTAPAGKEKTGYRPSRAMAGTRCCASTGRWNRFSTRPGGRGRSSPSRDFADVIPPWATDRSDVDSVLTILFARVWFKNENAD